MFFLGNHDKWFISYESNSKEYIYTIFETNVHFFQYYSVSKIVSYYYILNSLF